MDKLSKIWFQKRGIWEGGRSWTSLLIGLILFILGAIPLLSGWGALPFGLPTFLQTLIATIALYIIAAGGFSSGIIPRV